MSLTNIFVFSHPKKFNAISKCANYLIQFLIRMVGLHVARGIERYLLHVVFFHSGIHYSTQKEELVRMILRHFRAHGHSFYRSYVFNALEGLRPRTEPK